MLEEEILLYIAPSYETLCNVCVDQHVSRVWSDLTPSRSPGHSSPRPKSPPHRRSAQPVTKVGIPVQCHQDGIPLKCHQGLFTYIMAPWLV